MAKKKYNSGEELANGKDKSEEAYVVWGDDIASRKEAMSKASESLEECTLIERSSAGRRYSLDYSNLDGRTGGRPGLTRTDYDFFRPDEAVPRNNIKLIMRRAEDVYHRIGLVKNVIDLMADFGVQGIRLIHTNKKIERFYQKWFDKVSGKDRSERFLNNLYKTGNIVINKQTAKIGKNAIDTMYKAAARPDILITNIEETSPEKKEIPWIYTFIDPVYVDVASGSLASFVHNKHYQLSLPAHLRKLINSPKTDADKQIIADLPEAIILAAKEKKPFHLNPEKTIVYHYKKDDWQSFAYPMIYAIMDDINVIEKLKLADMAALDGAISNIRIFKLGSLEHKIAPTKAATAKLASILGNNVGGGTMDLVWGPDIELLESNTNVHQFLGEGKYVPHLNSIYAGLGIPPTLTGTFGAAGTTNNFISLKTLTQRLQYGRDVLSDFWNNEIMAVQKAMGFRKPARLEFDRMDLSNEEAEKSLLIQLVDRNIISDEIIQKRFGFDPEMEKTRLNRETRARKTGRMVKKASPWHEPEFENALKKTLLQLGMVTPGELNLELNTKKNGEKTAMEMKMEEPKKSTKLANDPSSESLPGQPGEGRPKLSKDQNKRKTKKFAPQTGAKLTLWANETQEKISETINPIILEYFNKKNLRSLSKEQTSLLEQVKTSALFNSQPFCKIDKNYIDGILENVNNQNDIVYRYYEWFKVLQSEIDRDLTVDETKYAKSSFYASVFSEE